MKDKGPSTEYINLTRAQVKWYRKNGKFPQARIVRDFDGIEYVIGDWSWNRSVPWEQHEYVDDLMQDAAAPFLEP